MRQNPKSDPVSQSDSNNDSLNSLLIDMADATWRMFVPIVGLLLVGRYADMRLGTKPWLMLAGAFLGSVVAYLLIKRLLIKGSKDQS